MFFPLPKKNQTKSQEFLPKDVSDAIQYFLPNMVKPMTTREEFQKVLENPSLAKLNGWENKFCNPVRVYQLSDYLNRLGVLFDYLERNYQKRRIKHTELTLRSLMKPIFIREKFLLAKDLYLKDLQDAIMGLEIETEIKNQQIVQLYKRSPPQRPYLENPRYSPYYWVFYGNYSLLEMISVSENLRDMLSTKSEMFDTFGSYYTVPSYRDGEFIGYEELDDLIHTDLLVKKSFKTLLDRWSLGKNWSMDEKIKRFQKYSFTLLRERSEAIQNKISDIRSQDLRFLRQQANQRNQEIRQIKALNLSTEYKMKRSRRI